MSRPHVKYLLLGGGLASSSAAGAIRTLDKDGAILLVGAESTRPYHRPPLSKGYLRQQTPRHELFALDPAWCAAHGVALRTGARAAHLDTARRAVVFDTGQDVSYDQVLIATGGTPARLKAPGADLPGLYYLRTLEDADRLHHAVEKARREGRPHARPRAGADAAPPSTGRGRVAVIGGGLLGVELAASLHQVGLSVELLVAGPHPWAKFAGESTGRLVARFLESRGVAVHLGAPPLRLEGAGRVQRVVVPAGADAGDPGPRGGPARAIDCDFAVAALGTTPHKDLLRGTPVAAEKAILADAYGRTNVPGVWAAGDCCALLDPAFGKHRVLDHWDHARATGALAGRNMAGAGEPYAGVNFFTTAAFELEARAWGQAGFVDRRLVRGSAHAESPALVEIGVAPDGRVAQVLALGPADEAADRRWREIVRRRVNVTGKEEALTDPASRVEDWME